MKPSDPRANATTGGTGPLNNDAACLEGSSQFLVSVGEQLGKIKLSENRNPNKKMRVLSE